MPKYSLTFSERYMKSPSGEITKRNPSKDFKKTASSAMFSFSFSSGISGTETLDNTIISYYKYKIKYSCNV